jgi:enamine deaminase RidA (YjgF/YER057c/UK114 family)
MSRQPEGCREAPRAHLGESTGQLRMEYLGLDALQAAPRPWWQQVLALVRFEDGAAQFGRLTPEDIPTAQVHCPLLGNAPARAEVWRLDGALSSGRVGRVHYRRGEQLLFASLSVHEHECDDVLPLAWAVGSEPAADGALAAKPCALGAATQLAYRELFQALDALGCPHALRIWHHLPQINEPSDGVERYWHFNSARREAFQFARRNLAGNVPAASALGALPGTALTVHCIAAARPPLPIENPRQCSAWDYPTQYGPRPPTFSRACLQARQQPVLFISGTASILGHRSVHTGDVVAQTHETLSNIHALVEAANRELGRAHHQLRQLRYKVYVRHAADQPLIERILRSELGDDASVLFLQADVCRRELLVEIEALGI